MIKQDDTWTEEKFEKGGNTFSFANKGNFFVDMQCNGVTVLTFQLPRVDVNKRQFFMLFAKIYHEALELGIELGRKEFSESLRSLVNYGVDG